jgi:hypothetical protein
MWQDARSGPFLLDDSQRVPAVQTYLVVNHQRLSFSVPRFPWYY